ncbi:unnamed protein product [Zymoseptoria tritici ST99CH_3D1]|nr:unnamed protein product [Zymoseptoria tritici ST99CH_3D1]
MASLFEETSRPPRDSFTGDLVQIDVGPKNNRSTFRVHKNVLCHYSGYFTGALNGKFIEATTKRIDLAAEDPGIFTIFVYWLYRGCIPPPGEGLDYTTLCKLWVFGDARSVPLLQNAAMALLIRRAATTRSAPSNSVDYIYSNTMPDSPLRRVLIDLVKKVAGRKILPSAKEWPKDALLDLAEAVWTDGSVMTATVALASFKAKDYCVPKKTSSQSTPHHHVVAGYWHLISMAPPSVRGKGPTSEMYDEIVEITVGIGKSKKTFKVHKGIVCHYSGYFDKALNGDFKEGKTGKIMLPEEEVGLFQRLVHWLYSGEIELEALAENGWDSMLSRLWVLADRRDIPLLMNMCIDALLGRIAQKWEVPNGSVMNRVYENTMEATMSKSRRTFSGNDPLIPSTPAAGTIRASQRRLQNHSSENSNSSKSTTASGDLASFNFSNTSSPGTDITDPDDHASVPVELESEATLTFFGLNDARAHQFWAKWIAINQTYYNGDFCRFTCDSFYNCVELEGSVEGESEEEWRTYLRKIGINETLVSGLADRGEAFDDIRLTQSPASWVNDVIEAKWEWLLEVHKRSDLRGKGGIDVSAPGNRNAIRVHALTEIELDKDADVEKILWSYENSKPMNESGELLKLNHIPLWKGVLRVRAEHMWAGPLRTGTFSLANVGSRPATDFAAKKGAQYWTPDLEAAQHYANYAKKAVAPAGVCLVRLELPNKLLKDISRKRLVYPTEDWKRVVYYSRRSKEIEPYDLADKVRDTILLVGDTATKPEEVYGKMESWEAIKDKHTLRLKSGRLVTQFVWGHGRYSKPFEAELDKLESKITIRDVKYPQRLLPAINLEEHRKEYAFT